MPDREVLIDLGLYDVNDQNRKLADIIDTDQQHALANGYPGWQNVTDKDLADLRSDSERADDAWEDVIENAVYTDSSGKSWVLDLDDNQGALMLVPQEDGP